MKGKIVKSVKMVLKNGNDYEASTETGLDKGEVVDWVERVFRLEQPKPKPLIEDEKSRKVFREWAELFDAERFRVNQIFHMGRKTTVFQSTDLTTEPAIEIPGHIGKDSEIYTRVELIGEENSRPVIVNDVKYSSYEDYLKSRGKK